MRRAVQLDGAALVFVEAVEDRLGQSDHLLVGAGHGEAPQDHVEAGAFRGVVAFVGQIRFDQPELRRHHRFRQRVQRVGLPPVRLRDLRQGAASLAIRPAPI